MRERRADKSKVSLDRVRCKSNKRRDEELEKWAAKNNNGRERAILFSGAYQIKSHVLVFEQLAAAALCHVHPAAQRSLSHVKNVDPSAKLEATAATHTCVSVCWFSALSRQLKCIFNRRAATLINWPNASAVKFGRRELNLRRPSERPRCYECVGAVRRNSIGIFYQLSFF